METGLYVVSEMSMIHLANLISLSYPSWPFASTQAYPPPCPPPLASRGSCLALCSDTSLERTYLSVSCLSSQAPFSHFLQPLVTVLFVQFFLQLWLPPVVCQPPTLPLSRTSVFGYPLCRAVCRILGRMKVAAAVHCVRSTWQVLSLYVRYP